MREHILKLPKVELHSHLEGTIKPQLVHQIAQRNGIDLDPKLFDGALGCQTDVLEKTLHRLGQLALRGLRRLAAWADRPRLSWLALARRFRRLAPSRRLGR